MPKDRLVPVQHRLKAAGRQADVLQLRVNDGFSIHDDILFGLKLTNVG